MLSKDLWTRYAFIYFLTWNQICKLFFLFKTLFLTSPLLSLVSLTCNWLIYIARLLCVMLWNAQCQKNYVRMTHRPSNELVKEWVGERRICISICCFKSQVQHLTESAKHLLMKNFVGLGMHIKMFSKIFTLYMHLQVKLLYWLIISSFHHWG